MNDTIHVYVTGPVPPSVAGNVSVAAVGVCPWSIVAVDTVGAFAAASAEFTVTAEDAEEVVVTGLDAESVAVIL